MTAGPERGAPQATPRETALAAIERTIVETLRHEGLTGDPMPRRPYDADAEWSVIAAILEGEDPMELPIKPSDMQVPAAAAALEALLAGAKTDVDVAAELIRRGFPRGATDDLLSWAADAPVISRAQLVQRCEHVRELRRRAGLGLAALAVSRALSAELTFDGAVERLRAVIMELRS